MNEGRNNHAALSIKVKEVRRRQAGCAKGVGEKAREQDEVIHAGHRRLHGTLLSQRVKVPAFPRLKPIHLHSGKLLRTSEPAYL